MRSKIWNLKREFRSCASLQVYGNVAMYGEKFEGGHDRISGNYEVKFVRYYENREGASLAVLIDGHFAVHFVPAG